MKMIFSSGTPLSLSTSTALVAEPPVANNNKGLSAAQFAIRLSECVPSIGSNSST